MSSTANTTYKQGGTCGHANTNTNSNKAESSTGACGPLAIPLQPLPPQPTSLPTCSPADTPHCPPHPASCSSATICCVDKRGAREGPRGKMRGRQARDMAGLGQRTGVGGRARCISNCGGCQSCHVARGRRVPRRSTESSRPCCRWLALLLMVALPPMVVLVARRAPASGLRPGWLPRRLYCSRSPWEVPSPCLLELPLLLMVVSLL